MTVLIRTAESEADFAAFGGLVREYVRWCRERYAHLPWLVDMVFGWQGLEEEIAGVSEAYGPPRGKTLLAVEGGEVLGGVAYRDLGDGVCEMKRMFVPARFHGRGLGKRLCAAIADQARVDGFSVMRLDTAEAFKEAIGLYRSAGFELRTPYIEYPEKLAPLIVFMERRL